MAIRILNRSISTRLTSRHVYPKYPQVLTRVITSIYKYYIRLIERTSTRVHGRTKTCKILAGPKIGSTSTRTFAYRFYTYKRVNISVGLLYLFISPCSSPPSRFLQRAIVKHKLTCELFVICLLYTSDAADD